MQLPRARPNDDQIRAFFCKAVLVVWAIVLIVVCLRVTVQKKVAGRPRNSGYFVYVDAGRRWRSGQYLYTSLKDLLPQIRKRREREVALMGEVQDRESGAWGGFRYSPTAAILFVPLSYMPGAVGEVVWRWFLAAVSLGALYWCARRGIPRPLARRDWPIFFLMVLPAFTGCLNNGQSSCLIVACLLGAVAACCCDRWMLAALLVVIPTTLKLYPISMGLLLTLLYPRRFGWRFGLMMIVGFGLPFLLRPSTMLEDHQRWLWHLINDAKPTANVVSWDLDVRMLLYRIFGYRMSAGLFMGVQAVSAVAIAALTLAGRAAGWPRRVLIPRTLGLATVWMTAIGNATEPSTYILIFPTLAWSLWEIWVQRGAHRAGRSPGGAVGRVVLIAAYCLFMMAYVFLWFPGGKRLNSYGPEPLAGLLILGYLVVRSVRELRSRNRAAFSGHATLALARPSQLV